MQDVSHPEDGGVGLEAGRQHVTWHSSLDQDAESALQQEARGREAHF